MLFCQNFATIMTDRKEANSSQPIKVPSLSCPVLFCHLWHVQTRVLLPCPVLSCLVRSHPVLFLTSLPGPGGKGDMFPPDEHLPPYQPPSKSKQAGMCTNVPVNPQKNAASLYKSPHWLVACTSEGVFFCTQTHIHTHRRRPCVVSGDDKWSGRHSPVGNQFGVWLAWWTRPKLAVWPYVHTTSRSTLCFCLFSQFDLFSWRKLSHFVVLAFVKLETRKSSQKNM